MLPRTLRLEPAGTPQRAAVAWCIAGAGPEEWLREIERWSLPDESGLRLFILPASMRDRTAAGLFIILAHGAKPPLTPSGLGFDRIGNNLYAPVDAIVLPAISDAEANALNAWDGALVIHPALGAVGFEAADEYQVSDFIIPPPERPERWSAPEPGLPDLPRLVSVDVRAPTMEDLFGESAHEIGSEPAPEFTDDPRLNEALGGKAGIKEFLATASGMALMPFLRLAEKFIQNLPHSADKRNMWNALEDWLGRQIHAPKAGRAPSENLQEARRRALEKLLEELQKNPELGLRHALPLASAIGHRGLAPPSSQLGTRDTDFNLGRLNSSRRRHGWDVPADYQRELRRHYLELASREVQLGHHRRAAYIYAELLGDLSTAAIVLKNGGHHAEAAVLFRDHLHRPLEAAECFAAAGQIAEAVKLYETGSRWDKLGALYRLLGEDEKATTTFQRWVDELIAADDRLQAATLLLDELKDRTKAVALLETAWPDSRQSVACVERAFTLRGEAGEHGAALKLLESLVGASSPQRRREALAIYGRMQHAYPDRRVRSAADDQGRREISKALQDGASTQAEDLLRALALLAPNDRLLRRDTVRYLDTKRRPPKSNRKASAVKPPEASGEVTVQLESSFPLPWNNAVDGLLTAASSGDNICALAYMASANLLHVAHGNVHRANDWTYLSWEVPEQLRLAKVVPLVRLHPRQADRVLVSYADAPNLLLPDSAARRSQSGPALKIGPPPWLPDPLWAAAFDGNGDLWVLRMTGIGLRLSLFSSEGRLKSDHLVPSLEEAINDVGTDIPRPLPMVVTSRHLVFAVRTRLVAVPIGSEAAPEFGETSLYSPIRGLAHAPLWSSARVAVITEREVYIHWLGGTSHRNLLVCDQLADPPHAGFTNDGALLVVSGKKGFVIHANSSGKIQRWRFELPSKAAALLPLADLWKFAIIDETSRLGRWRYDNRQLVSS